MIIEELNQAISEKSFLSIRVNGLHFRARVLARLTIMGLQNLAKRRHLAAYFWNFPS